MVSDYIDWRNAVPSKENGSCSKLQHIAVICSPAHSYSSYNTDGGQRWACTNERHSFVPIRSHN